MIKNNALRFCVFFFLTRAVFADGIGGVALNVMDPVSAFYQFVTSGCLLFGGGFLFAALIKYFEHRRSPLMVPISTVVFLVISGLVLLALPLLAYVTQTGVTYKY